METSEGNKKRIAGQIFGENLANPPAKVAKLERSSVSVTKEGGESSSAPVLKFENCNSCTIHINFNK